MRPSNVSVLCFCGGAVCGVVAYVIVNSGWFRDTSDSDVGEQLLFELATPYLAHSESVSLQSVNGLQSSSLLLSKLGGRFWEGGETNRYVLQFLIRRALLDSQPVEVVEKFSDSIIALDTNSATRSWMLVEIGYTGLRSEHSDPLQLISVLTRYKREDAEMLLIGMINVQSGEGLESRYKRYVRCCGSLGWNGWKEDAQSAATFLTRTLTLSTEELTLDVPALFQFIKKCELENFSAFSLKSVIDRLALLAPSTLPSVLLEGMSSTPRLITRSLEKCSISPGLMKEILPKLPEPLRASVLTAYIERLWNATPAESLRISKEFPVNELPAAAAGTVAVGLLKIGAGQLDAWISKSPPEAVRAVLDSAMGQINANPGQVENLYNVGHAWLQSNGKASAGRDDTLLQAIQLAALADPPPSLDFLLTSARSALGGKKDTLVDRAIASYFGAIMLREAPVLPRIDEQTLLDLPSFYHTAAQGIATSDGDYAKILALIKTADDTKLRDELQLALIESAPGDMPFAERQHLLIERLKLVKSSKDIDRLSAPAESLVLQMGKSEPQKAVDLITQMPDSELKTDVAARFARQWASNDPISASEWISQMPRGAIRDKTAKELVLATRDDPEVAFSNAAAIGDEKERMTAARAVINAWPSPDKPRIAEFLMKSPLPIEERNALIEYLKTGPHK